MEPLREGRLAELRGRDAGVQRDRGDQDAARDQLGHELRGERAGRARHLGAPGLQREHGLIGIERPLVRYVGVPDRVAVSSQIGLERRAEEEAHDNEPLAPGEAREQLGVRTFRQPDSRARGRRPHGRPVGGAKLGDPRAFVPGRRESQLDRIVRNPRGKTGGQRSRGVHDEQVAGVEEVGEVPEAGMEQRAVAPVGDEHRDVVTAFCGRLGRLVRLTEPGERDGAHASAACSPEAAYRPLGREPAIRSSRPGTLASAGGRSEMSSSGKACWCSSVRMSPGS